MEFDLEMPDGRTLHIYDDGDSGATTVAYWHHGSPQTGILPEPLIALARGAGIRLVSHDRPGYGGSSPQSGRTIADVASDVTHVLDHLNIDVITTLGVSGGGPHALACAALLPERVMAVACIATIAPFDAPGLDWFEGMASSNIDEFKAAQQGRAALEAYGNTHGEFDPEMFAPADMQAMSGPYWEWFVSSAQGAMPSEGYYDDGLAFVDDWQFDPSSIAAPLLLVHGEDDRFVPVSHACWLAQQCKNSDLRVEPSEGHISIISSCESALSWLQRNSH